MKALKWKRLFLCVFGCGIIITAAYISENMYQLMLIHGNSMMPAYHDMQLVLLEKNFRVEALQPGDVIAFRCEGLDAILVKRIAAVPGQTVYITDGNLFVDNVRSDLFGDRRFEYAGILTDRVSLQDGEYIVIGDNIPESKDSRYVIVGTVQIESIIGKIVFPEK